MKKYSDLVAIDAKVSISKRLIEESKGALSLAQIREILDWHWDGGGAFGPEKGSGYGDLDLSCLEYFRIDIVDARRFGEEIQLEDLEISHSWAGEKIIREHGFIILGDFHFGIKSRYEYYDNGNLSSSSYDKRPGNFSLDQIQIALINQEIDDHLNNHHFGDYWNLYVYIPSQDLIDPETYELGKKLGFL